MLGYRIATLRACITITILLPLLITNLHGQRLVHGLICANGLTNDNFSFVRIICRDSFDPEHLARGRLAIAEHLLLVPAVI